MAASLDGEDKVEVDGEVVLTFPTVDLSLLKRFGQGQIQDRLAHGGTLQVLRIESALVWVCGKEQCVISVNVPVCKLSSRDFVFHMPDRTICVRLPVADASVLAEFEQLLCSHATFVDLNGPPPPVAAVAPGGSTTDNAPGQAVPEDTLSAGAPPPPPPVPADEPSAAAEAITSGSKALADGLRTGARFTAVGLGQLGGLVKSKTAAKTEDKEVHASVVQGVTGAKSATDGAVTISRGAVKGIERACWMVGTEAVYRVEKTDTYQKKFGGEGNRDTSKPLSKSEKLFSSVKEIGGASVTGAVTVYESVLDSGKIVGQGAKDATVEVVDHKYGNSAAAVAADACDAVGNVGVAAYNCHSVYTLGVTDVAMQAAVESASYAMVVEELLAGSPICSAELPMLGSIASELDAVKKSIEEARAMADEKMKGRLSKATSLKEKAEFVGARLPATSWETVWVVVRGRGILVYPSKEHAEDAKKRLRPTAILDFEDLLAVGCRMSDEGPCFQVVARDKFFVFKCSTANDTLAWVVAAATAAHRLTLAAGTATGAPP